jgi:hypothetical protein
MPKIQCCMRNQNWHTCNAIIDSWAITIHYMYSNCPLFIFNNEKFVYVKRTFILGVPYYRVVK